MENSNLDTQKNNYLEEPAEEPMKKPVVEPQKPSLIKKLKDKRWTFKLKNNFTEYVTVEPLICFLMLQIVISPLIEPYRFHKACISLEEETNFCNVMTINEKYQACATNSLGSTIHCKGLSRTTGKIDCMNEINNYQYGGNRTRVYVKPEDYRFCKVIEKTADKLYKDASVDTWIGVSAQMMQFLVCVVVSAYSDKKSKRKICLILPTLGQLLASIINLSGAISTFLSFEFIKISTMFILSLSGGMELFFFGCYSYMNNESVRRKLLFRFGVISLALTIYRCIPRLHRSVYQYYRDDNSYLNLISINLAINIICVLYVKIILNESKREKALVDDSGSITSENNSVGKDGTARKYSKSKQLAKIFVLDVVWDYLMIVFKKRVRYGRPIIMFFLVILFVEKIIPYGQRFSLIFNENITIDSVDVDGAIFVIISIMMLVLPISDVLITVLVISMPIATRLLAVILKISSIAEDIKNDLTTIDYNNPIQRNAGTDFYTPFKRIASCIFFFSYVDTTESRIFLIALTFVNGPGGVGQFNEILKHELKDKLDLDFDILDLTFEFKARVMISISLVVFCALGLLYFIDHKVKSRNERKTFKR